MWEENPCTMLIRRLYLSLARLSNRILHQHDLTMSQLMTLLLLSGSSEKELSLKELERILDVAQSTCAGIVNRLALKKLVEGFTDPADKRIKLVRIRPEGEQCCQDARERMQEIDQIIFQGLTEEEQDTVQELLQKIYDNVSKK